MDEKELTLMCDCKSLAHVIQFSSWEDDYHTLSIQMHLRPHRSIFARFRLALRYITGTVGDAWSFEDIVLMEEDVRRIHEFIGDFLKEA